MLICLNFVQVYLYRILKEHNGEDVHESCPEFKASGASWGMSLYYQWSRARLLGPNWKAEHAIVDDNDTYEFRNEGLALLSLRSLGMKM